MATFQRLVPSTIFAFQFRLQDIGKELENATPIDRARNQGDAQRAILNEIRFPLTLGAVEVGNMSGSDPKTLVLTVSVPNIRGTFLHRMKLGDWFIVEPLVGKIGGEVLSNQQFNSLAATPI